MTWHNQMVLQVYRKEWASNENTNKDCTESGKKYENKIMEFHRLMINGMNSTNYELGQIGNMEEVPFLFDIPSNKCVYARGKN